MKKSKPILTKILSWILIVFLVLMLAMAAARIVTWKLFWMAVILIAATAYFVIPKLRVKEETG